MRNTPFTVADSKRIANIEGLVNVLIYQLREIKDKLEWLGLLPDEEPVETPAADPRQLAIPEPGDD